jgi:glycosyltransferase involved in cell wall biosynthesis
VLTCSASVGESFKLDGLRRSYRVAYTGADVGSNREAGRQPFEASVEMLCVGRLNAWKGQEVLIEAVAELRRRGLDAKLRLVGDVFGGQRHFWNALATQIARLGLAEHVTMLGFRTDVGELMTSADVVVVPSQRPEPFGMVVVEAMALGRCVVATAAGGPSEIIEDGVSGLLVPSGSATAIADAVGRLAADPVLAREVAAAARRRAAGFSHRAMTACILESYAALLARPEPLPAQATARTAERAAAR